MIGGLSANSFVLIEFEEGGGESGGAVRRLLRRGGIWLGEEGDWGWEAQIT